VSVATIIDWLGQHEVLLFWLGAGSLIIFLISPVVVAGLVVRIPEDYFFDPHRHISRLHRLHPAIWLLIVLFKNIVGVVVFLAGVAMLVLPGQGLLTMLIGLLLIDFPGKFALERRLICRPGVLRAVNWIRAKGRKRPLLAPDNDPDPVQRIGNDMD
jgi:hypothetical protein